MRIALAFQDGNFVGREYFTRLAAAGLAPNLVVAVGRMKPESIAIERERTGGQWNPPEIPDSAVTHRFAKTSAPEFAASLREARIDVAIQGGIGILRGDVLDAPRIGWLNVHPGKLPEYRGNSCPEWAVLKGDPVIATAHLIDAGIDTGPVICAAPYDFAHARSYAEFRAKLYAQCAAVLVRALAMLATHDKRAATPQASTGARYHQPVPPALLEQLRARFPLNAA